MNYRRSFIAMLAASPFVVLLAWGMTRDPREIPSPLPGRVAPTFDLAVFARGDMTPPDAKLDTVRLAEHRGNVVVLNYWASWCLACRDEHRALSDVAAEYNAAGVRDVSFYGVLYNDSPRNGIDWIAQMGGQSYPSLVDPGSRTAIDYGLYGVPETFFIGRDGKVAYKHIGPVTPALLKQKIDSLRGAGGP
jgi:cytochrome c biogenesis protein CcmG, thiol:disulfide interchange protein DsbE